MDVSGGEFSVHNTAFNIFNSDGSGVLRITPRKITVKDDIGEEVDISLSYLVFLNSLVPPDGQAVSIPDKVKYIFTSGTETRIGKPDASSNFRVFGNTYVEQNLFVGLDSSFGQNILLTGDASFNSNLYVKSKTSLGNDLSLNGNIFVYGGDASLNGRLFVSADASLNSNLYVKAKTRLGNDLSLNGNIFVYGGDASLNGRLFVSKDASLNGNLYLGGRMRIYENIGTVASGTNGSLTFEHGDASGSSSIVFKSKNDPSDYGFIQYTEHVGGTGYTSTLDNGLLMIGVANNGSNPTNRDRIVLWSGADPNDATAPGKVGINTKFPEYTLDVNGDVNIESHLYMKNNTIIKAGNTSGVIEDFCWPRANDNITYINYGSAGFHIRNNSESVSPIFIKNNGTIGINDTTPSDSYKLDVNGNVNETSYNDSSDYLIKTNVKSLDASFNVDVLKPVTYINTRHGRQDIGFIAHEVQEHYPFLVNGEKDGEQIQSLNYIGLIGILTKEIQDLKWRLAETEAKADNHNQMVNKKIDVNMEQVYSMFVSAEAKVASIEETVASIEDTVASIEDKALSVEDKALSVENTIASVENTIASVENTIASVENTVLSVENTVLLEQARLLICETDVALSKSAIKDLEERFQS